MTLQYGDFYKLKVLFKIDALGDTWHTYIMSIFYIGPKRADDLVSTMPRCVGRKVKVIGPFSASSEWNQREDVILNWCERCSSIPYG